MTTVRYYGWVNDNKLSGIEAWAYFDTEDEAKAFVAQFPKYVAVKSYRVSGFGDANATTYSNWFGAGLNVFLRADEVNKGKNETGLKRARKFFEVARTLDGITVEYAGDAIGNGTDVLKDGTL